MKVLYISNGHIGDAVLSMGILQYFLDQHPSCKLTVVSAPVVVHLFQDIPQLTNCIVVKKKTYRRHWIDIYNQTKQTSWDIIINMRSSGLSYILRAKKRYDFVWKKPFTHQHVIEEKQQLFGLPNTPYPNIIVSKQRHELISNQAKSYHQPIIAISPFAYWQDKCWPRDKYVDLIKELKQKNDYLSDAYVAVFGGDQDRKNLPYFQAAFKDSLIDLVNNGHLLDKAAWISHCALYISNDTGGAHMAAAMNCPTVALFGPTDPNRYRPIGKRATYIKTPCHADDKEHPMQPLSVDMVYQEIIQSLFPIQKTLS